MALIQPRPPIPGTPPDDGDFDERESIAMEGKKYHFLGADLGANLRRGHYLGH